ncbi:MAG: translation elongation factor Ts [Bacilli bacterium]
MSELIDLIKQLRERTGAGLMDCKKALLANDNDISKASTWLREKGIAKQEQKAATRIAAEGVAWVVTEGDRAAVIEINCETDFVANSDPFRELVKTVAGVILRDEPADMDTAIVAKDENGKTIKDLFVDAGIKLGEKLDFRRFVIVHKNADEHFGPYIHMKGKIAVLAVVKGGDDEIANGIALNICSCNPSYIAESDIPGDVIARETEIEKEASKNDPAFAKKPEAIQNKIIEGRVRKNLCDNVLDDELYVLDQEKKVKDVLKSSDASVTSFVRYAVGEGIEKRKDDFAAEVASQVK